MTIAIAGMASATPITGPPTRLMAIVISSTITSFLDTFTKIKNVDFRDSEGLEELRKMYADETDFKEMQSMVSFAGSIAGGAVAGTAGGALIAFGAYGAAQALACASTGTAIAS